MLTPDAALSGLGPGTVLALGTRRLDTFVANSPTPPRTVPIAAVLPADLAADD